MSSAVARTEVARSLLPLGPAAVARGLEKLRRPDLIRVSDRVLADAGTLMPPELRSLDAIHLATVSQLGSSLFRVVAYDQRLSAVDTELGFRVLAPPLEVRVWGELACPTGPEMKVERVR